MAANIETMFYIMEKLWHRLGTMVQEAPSSADDWYWQVGIGA